MNKRNKNEINISTEKIFLLDSNNVNFFSKLKTLFVLLENWIKIQGSENQNTHFYISNFYASKIIQTCLLD